MEVRNPLSKFQADSLYEPKYELIEVACLSGDSVGDLVCLRDVQTGTGRWRVQQADCFNENLMPAIGILVSKSSSTTGVIRRLGPVDTVYVGLDPTEHYFVGSVGSLVTPAPAAPVGGIAVVQKIGIPVDSDILWLTGEIGPLYKRVGY